MDSPAPQALQIRRSATRPSSPSAIRDRRQRTIVTGATADAFVDTASGATPTIITNQQGETRFEGRRRRNANIVVNNGATVTFQGATAGSATIAVASAAVSFNNRETATARIIADMAQCFICRRQHHAAATRRRFIEVTGLF